jgi:hypothetical protein
VEQSYCRKLLPIISHRTQEHPASIVTCETRCFSSLRLRINLKSAQNAHSTNQGQFKVPWLSSHVAISGRRDLDT